MATQFTSNMEALQIGAYIKLTCKKYLKSFCLFFFYFKLIKSTKATNLQN